MPRPGAGRAAVSWRGGAPPLALVKGGDCGVVTAVGRGVPRAGAGRRAGAIVAPTLGSALAGVERGGKAIRASPSSGIADAIGAVVGAAEIGLVARFFGKPRAARGRGGTMDGAAENGIDGASNMGPSDISRVPGGGAGASIGCCARAGWRGGAIVIGADWTGGATEAGAT